MIGVFTTRCFDSRPQFERGEAAKVFVNRNRFTSVGLEWMWKSMAGFLRAPEGTLLDHLGKARLVVGNGEREFLFSDTRLSGDQTGEAALDEGYPLVSVVHGDEGLDACQILFRATFGEDNAPFDWQERGVVTAQGVLIDRSVADQGRKVLGAIWQLEAALVLDS